MENHIPMGDYHPSCPKCGEHNFVAVQNLEIDKADLPLTMIICKNMGCQAVVGVVPSSQVFFPKKG